MSIFNRRKKQDTPSIHSQQLNHEELKLVRDTERRARKRTVIDIQREVDALTRKDMGHWRMAWQLAINPDNPDRRLLYDIYADVMADLHLSGCIEQNHSNSLSTCHSH